jgi:hypothetical protein
MNKKDFRCIMNGTKSKNLPQKVLNGLFTGLKKRCMKKMIELT